MEYTIDQKLTGRHLVGWDVYDLSHVISDHQDDHSAGSAKLLYIRVKPDRVPHHIQKQLYTMEDSSLYFYTIIPDTNILESMLQHKHPSRRKRNTMFATGNDCGLHPWYVTFSSIGWDNNIVVPAGINANFCRGSCKKTMANMVSNNKREGLTNHALVKYSFRVRNPESTVKPEVHCVPMKFSSTSIVFRENQTSTKLKIIDRFQVDSCGCV